MIIMFLSWVPINLILLRCRHILAIRKTFYGILAAVLPMPNMRYNQYIWTADTKDLLSASGELSYLSWILERVQSYIMTSWLDNYIQPSSLSRTIFMWLILHYYHTQIDLLGHTRDHLFESYVIINYIKPGCLTAVIKVNLYRIECLTCELSGAASG